MPPSTMKYQERLRAARRITKERLQRQQAEAAAGAGSPAQETATEPTQPIISVQLSRVTLDAPTTNEQPLPEQTVQASKRKRSSSPDTSDSEPLFCRQRTSTPASLQSSRQSSPQSPAESGEVTDDNREASPPKKVQKRITTKVTKRTAPTASSSRQADVATSRPTSVSAGMTSSATPSVRTPPDSPVLGVTNPLLVQEPPKWYLELTKKQLNAKGTGDRGKEAKLHQIRDLITRAKNNPSPAEFHRILDDMRRELHSLAFLEVDKIMVRRKRMLHAEDGLPQIFNPHVSGGVAYPADIRSDALEQYTRWYYEVFSVDLLRGTTKENPDPNKKRNVQRRLEPGFPGRKTADHWGHGDLVNGQWWPTQLCTVRDGAHGATQGGIFARGDQPAYSIVMAGGGEYRGRDADEGDEAYYCGTEGKDGKRSDNTASLVKNVENRVPVRVIRSYNFTESHYAPRRGYRYDGLYDVVSYRVVDAGKQVLVFKLRRQDGQDPIRYIGEAARPTAEEIAKYDEIKQYFD